MTPLRHASNTQRARAAESALASRAPTNDTWKCSQSWLMLGNLPKVVRLYAQRIVQNRGASIIARAAGKSSG